MVDQPEFVPFQMPAEDEPWDPVDPAWKKAFEEIKAMSTDKMSDEEKSALCMNKIWFMLKYVHQLPGSIAEAYHKELATLALELGMDENMDVVRPKK
jgi:hypothetical protein